MKAFSEAYIRAGPLCVENVETEDRPFHPIGWLGGIISYTMNDDFRFLVVIDIMRVRLEEIEVIY